MKSLNDLTLAELRQLLQVVDDSLLVFSHLQLFNWLNQGVRALLPHNIVIAAWGDFSLGLVRYDLVSALPGLRTDDINDSALQPFVTDLFTRWKQNNCAPYAVASSGCLDRLAHVQDEMLEKLQGMSTTLVHCIKDQRGRHDCLYIFLGPEYLGQERPRQLLRYLLPYLDAAFRQVVHLLEQYLPANGSPTAELAAHFSAPTEETDAPTDDFGSANANTTSWNGCVPEKPNQKSD